MTYNCTQPYYGAPDNSLIDVIWDHPEFGPIPFTASPLDVTTYGPEIYEEAENGDYGPVISFEASHWYCTVQGTVWEGKLYGVGNLMISPTGIQPPNSTNQPIPAPPSL
jgi:hypothetical protein